MPTLKQLQHSIHYHNDPTEIFNQLCAQRTATLLLESAEIDNKQGIKSVMIIDAALRITASNNQVTIVALTENGASLLPLLAQSFKQGVDKILETEKQTLILNFTQINNDLDEDSRLKSLSVFDALRHILNVVKLPAEASPDAIL